MISFDQFAEQFCGSRQIFCALLSDCAPMSVFSQVLLRAPAHAVPFWRSLVQAHSSTGRQMAARGDGFDRNRQYKLPGTYMDVL
jgi:hypothetical protein